jgi:hypothetical protein
MGKTRRFALLLGLSAALSLDALPALAQSAAEGADESEAQEGSEEEAPASARRGKNESPEDRAARKEKRRERLEKGAKRLRDRAAELRKKAANGEAAPPVPANSKRPRRTLEEQAQRLEEQANKMEQRTKNLDSPDEARPERTPSSARQRRHQVRRSQLNKRWGATLSNPEAIEELKLHAERNARLKRIRTLAFQKSKDDPLVKRATSLMTKEEARHDQVMKRIQAKTPNAPATETTTGEEAK